MWARVDVVSMAWSSRAGSARIVMIGSRAGGAAATVSVTSFTLWNSGTGCGGTSTTTFGSSTGAGALGAAAMGATATGATGSTTATTGRSSRTGSGATALGGSTGLGSLTPSRDSTRVGHSIAGFAGSGFKGATRGSTTGATTGTGAATAKVGAAGADTAGDLVSLVDSTILRRLSTRSKYTTEAPFTSRWRNSKQSISRKLSCLSRRRNASVIFSTMNRMRGGREEAWAIG